jgi:hypothetical protein
MGDRACILFFDDTWVSPTVYLHWHGSAVPALLDRLAIRMRGRYGDAGYAAARFTGLCHERIDGNLSLGISSNTCQSDDVQSAALMTALSSGDAGMVVVDTRDFSWRAYGGYLSCSKRRDS